MHHEGHEEWHSVQAATGGVKPAGVKTGLLMNFNVTSGGVVNRTGAFTTHPRLKSGIKRFVL